MGLGQALRYLNPWEWLWKTGVRKTSHVEKSGLVEEKWEGCILGK